MSDDLNLAFNKDFKRRDLINFSYLQCDVIRFVMYSFTRT